jgi:hypothetical protein
MLAIAFGEGFIVADIIQASWFYTYEFEKVKFNWFCFEFALKLYDNIKVSKQLKKWILNVNDIEIANFCAYFAKRMKKSVEDRLAGITDVTEADEEYLTDYYHTNTPKQNAVILRIIEKAWEQLLSVCVTCPTRCLSERHARCEFFDRMERGGYFA